MHQVHKCFFFFHAQKFVAKSNLQQNSKNTKWVKNLPLIDVLVVSELLHDGLDHKHSCI